MRVYIVIKYNWSEFCGIALVTTDKKAAEQYCKLKNKTSRDITYHVIAKQLKGYKHG